MTDWYKDSVIYEVHVRAFADSDGDGIGDFRGLTQRLDYLHDLGVTAIWLLPFYPSPLRDDGYDIADYTGVHPNYGSLADFRQFLRQAHRRDLRVITELVINHTSDQHSWFQRARRAPAGTSERNFYVWSETPDRYRQARIIFSDTETSNWAWDPLAGAYYWHRFFSHQPDLNFENPEVRRAVVRALDFWLEMGVDGLRLDAIPYLYEAEGTMCENLPQTHQFLKELRAHVDRTYTDRMLLAEANQWPEDAIAYLGDGDECHMAFHFPVMPRLFMGLRSENRFPIVDILQQTPAIPESCQWAVFLRNHDELTLEMVTDEERDYMYRSYAQDPEARVNLGIRRRLGPLLGNNRRSIELMNALLLSLPGTPVIYYGDEIGMGDNIYLGDRNGVRTPMQWNADRNAGFSRANPQQLYLPVIIDPEYHYETLNVEAQQNNPHSLLWFTKRILTQRSRLSVFGRGDIELLYPDNPRVLAFLRRHRDQSVLVVANLSRFVQSTELDLSGHAGATPVEMFGRTRLPAVGESPYLLTMGPHSFYWLSLEEELQPVVLAPIERHLVLNGSLESVFEEPVRARLEAVLAEDLPQRRWFPAKARTVQSSTVVDAVPFPAGDAWLVFLRLAYVEGDPETYLIPLAFAFGEQADRILSGQPQAVVARIKGKNGDGVLHDPTWEPRFGRALLALITGRKRLKGDLIEVRGFPSDALRGAAAREAVSLEPSLLGREQSNTSLVYGDRYILKLYRRLEPGPNPDLELGRFLTAQAGFAHIPPVAGALEYRLHRREQGTLAILAGFAPNQGDAWEHTLDVLGLYYEQVLASPEGWQPEVPSAHLLDLANTQPTDQALDLIGTYLAEAELLGERTAQFHLALASGAEQPDFAPEPVTTLYQRSLYQSMRTLARETFHLARRRLHTLPEAARADAERLLAREEALLERFRAVHIQRISTYRTRVHGDYHLGQVLFTGKDFVIIDFEGEPSRPLGERRLKRSPLRDVAGMIRSFHYAAYAALFEEVARGDVGDSPEALAALGPAARFWYRWVAAGFLRAYLTGVGGSGLVPDDRTELQVLLDAFLLEKAVYELAYELNNRPDWVRIPLEGIAQQLDA